VNILDRDLMANKSHNSNVMAHRSLEGDLMAHTPHNSDLMTHKELSGNTRGEPSGVIVA
jgi:hypothetical protein